MAAMTFLACPSAIAAQDEGSIQVHGDSVEYFHDQAKVVGTGHVRIDYEDTLLTADKVTVYMATKVAMAEGHVVLTQKGTVFKGERGEYNFQTKVGNVAHMDAEIPPSLYAKAKTIERVSPTHYRASDGYVTTCCGDSPFYRVQSQSLDIYPGQKVVIRNAVVYVKNIPIFFIPLYVQPLFNFDRFPVQIIPGKNPEWGAFILSKWRYSLKDAPDSSSKGNVLVDWRERRGFGYGVDNYYKGSKLGRGAIRTYYANDGEPPPEAHPGRYRGQWRHQAKLAEDTTLTTEINKLSDATIIKDFFFREEYERDVFPDNYVSIITARPEYSLSFLDRQRMDDFFTVVERSPEIRFDTHTRSFPSETPFYLRQEAQASSLKKVFANSKEELDVSRFDLNHTLSYAAHAGAFSVTPRVGTRQTYYSRLAQRDEGSAVRGTFDPGLDLSTRYYRVYDVSVHAWGLDYNQIRHVFSPSAGYNFRPNPTILRTQLQPFDQLDELDKQNFIRFNFENKFQTKQRGSKNELTSREIARFLPFFDYDFDTQHLENAGLEAQLNPYPWLSLSSDSTYNTRSGKFDTANFDIGFSRRGVKLAVGQRYVREESSQTTADIRWSPNSVWAFKVYERYEFADNHSKEFEATVSRAFSCIIVDFTYNHRDGDTFYVVFRLKGYPNVSFDLSQSYNTPRTQAARQVYSTG